MTTDVIAVPVITAIATAPVPVASVIVMTRATADTYPLPPAVTLMAVMPLSLPPGFQTVAPAPPPPPADAAGLLYPAPREITRRARTPPQASWTPTNG